MKSTLISLVIGLALAYGGYTLMNSQDHLISQASYDQSESRCSNGVKTMGVLRDSIMQEVREDDDVIVGYEIFYSFDVNGSTYQAAKKIKNLETEGLPVADVWYDSTNPKSNILRDPCVIFENIKKNKKVGESSSWRTIVGIIIGLGGLSLAWGSFKGLIGGAIRGGGGQQQKPQA